jgi:short-subunit dehydrogenase
MNPKTEIVITGASSGLGAAFAQYYAQEGYSIAIQGRRKEKLEVISDTLTRKHPRCSIEIIIAELSEDYIRREFYAQIEKLPNLKALINNAGFNIDGRFHTNDIELYKTLTSTHMDATVELTHAALPALIENKGTLINVSSISAFIPTPLSPLYGATKVFIKAFTDSIAANYADEGLKAITLCPGFIRTDFHSKLGINTDEFYKRKGLYKAYTPKQVVEKAIHDLNRGKTLSIKGANYRAIYIIAKLMPQWVSHWLGRQTKSSRPK